MEFPSLLETGRGVLRRLTADDGVALHRYLSDPLVYESTSADPWTPAAVEEFLSAIAEGEAAGRWCRLGIVADGAAGPVGTIGLFNLDEHNQRAEIGYDLAPEWWGRGIATGAVNQLIDWAFKNGLHRIEATVMAGNRRSVRVLERAGFEREGYLRKYKRVRGDFRDFLLYARLRG